MAEAFILSVYTGCTLTIGYEYEGKTKRRKKKKEKRTKRYEHDLHTSKLTVEKRYKWVLQDVKTNK